jgi:hypothetical protein
MHVLCFKKVFKATSLTSMTDSSLGRTALILTERGDVSAPVFGRLSISGSERYLFALSPTDAAQYDSYSSSSMPLMVERRLRSALTSSTSLLQKARGMS